MSTRITVKPTANAIADALDQYGPLAKLGIPAEVGPDAVKVVAALDLAIEKLRDQAHRIEALEGWQDRVLGLLQKTRCAMTVEEYVRADIEQRDRLGGTTEAT